MRSIKRVVVTGMSVITPFADTLPEFLDCLLSGRSAVSRIRAFDPDSIYVKIAGDLSGYDEHAKLMDLETRAPEDVMFRLKRLMRKAPWSARLTMLNAVDGWADANLFGGPLDSHRVATLVAGQHINSRPVFENVQQFLQEPDFIDGGYSVFMIDTSFGSLVSEILQHHGSMYTVGAACASGNTALQCAVNEIRSGHVDVAMILGLVYDFSPIDLHALALVNAVSYESFNDEPHRASRPFDIRREGFVPSHGGATLIVEDMDHAKRRGARIYAELVAVGCSSSGNHEPQSSEESQAALMSNVMKEGGVAPRDIGYINAHATSTPLGDLAEARAIRRVFRSQGYNFKVNATKSMLGHTCWSSAVVETVAATLQMNASKLHPSINVEVQDPEADFDLCKGSVDCDFEFFLKNSFGFGGYNSVALFRRYTGD